MGYLEPILAAVILPFASAVVSHLIAKWRRGGATLAKLICILAAYITLFIISCLIIFCQQPMQKNLFTILTPTGILTIGFYIDYLALVLAFISSMLTLLALVYNISYLSPYNRAYNIGWAFNRSYSFILLFNCAVLGTLFSSNLLQLIIFWEMMSVFSYVLISFRNEDKSSLWAAIKFFVMTHGGSLTLLIAAVIINSHIGNLEIHQIGRFINSNDPIINIIFPLLLFAALPKAALFPLHTWLPDATVAPTPNIIVFHECGVLAGVYIIIRFFLDVFRKHLISSYVLSLPILGNVNLWCHILSIIGAVTLLIGAINGLTETNMKRILAYGTISEVGCIIMATGLTTSYGMSAGLYLLISHAFCFSLLFFCIGAVTYSTGRYDINDVTGLYHFMPKTAVCCVIGALTMSTAPFLSEFVGKFLFFHATINAQATFYTAIAFLGCVLNAAMAMRLLNPLFMQRNRELNFKFEIKDPSAAMLTPMIFLSTILIIFGVVPSIPLNFLVAPAVRDIGLTLDLPHGWIIQTSIGFWDPSVLGVTMVCLSSVLLVLVLRSAKAAAAYRGSPSEETFKPFLCGEDLKMLDNPGGSHFYHALTYVLKIDAANRSLNIDKFYNLLSNSLYDLCQRILRWDIQQSYFGAVASFMAGAVLVILFALLGG
ncbi:MAG: proton-conducting transporter membrane subunit [Nitrososphaerota archaeon]|nr:hypothetical protein [Candidatus Bathyarchaeota archaeon]MDW8048202.1 proton-conducting transporter membrane subunit [Nitrososphaerota archaeon]